MKTQLPETIRIKRSALDLLDSQTREWVEAQLLGVIGTLKAAVRAYERIDPMMDEAKAGFHSHSIEGQNV